MDAIDLIPFAFPGLPNVACAFTTRRGGAARGPFARGNLSFDVGDDPLAVAANRTALAASLGLSLWQELRQVHGPDMVFDPEPAGPEDPPVLEGDGLATALPGQSLVIKTADCQPILLAHTNGRHIAALHAGWRGNRLGFPRTGVQAFCERYGLSPADILAVRGPSLGPAAAEFTNFEAEFGPQFADFYDPERRTVNLWTLTRRQLMDAGVPPTSIFGLDLCTRSLPETFFSYRRDKTTGRQAALIWMK